MPADIVIDLATLTGMQGFVALGAMQGDAAGTSVSNAGDINGDGIDDLIIGAPSAGERRFDEGAAYVVFGKAGPSRATVDLSDLGSNGFSIVSDLTWAAAGLSVSSAGDINNDGYDDVIVGVPGGNQSAGEAYVIYGKAGASRDDIDLSAVSASDGFVIQGHGFGDTAGESVSDAGDVNGDGFDDVIIGVPFAIGNGLAGDNAGEVYVIFGKAGATRNAIDLGSLSSGDGFAIQGGVKDGQLGHSVSSAGDINGDGYDDVIMAGASNLGEAYVIFGKPSTTRGTINAANIGSADGFTIHGDVFIYFQPGWSVSSAGDINNDGYDDLVVGVPFGDDGGQYAGEAYVIYGKAGATRGDITLSSLSASDGFVIQGDVEGDTAGVSVSSAGDINADGYADLIVGAPKGDDGGNNAGEAYVIYGKSGSTRPNIDLSSLALEDGLVIQGATEGDTAGTSVSSAGDINDDGFDDLIIGAPGGDGGATNSGEAYILFGGPDYRAPGPEWQLLATDGFVGEFGGNGEIFGTSDFQDIRVLDVAGTQTFDPSFNRGGDIVRLAGDASEWQVGQSGSFAVFSDGDTLAHIPVGTAGLAIVFDDGARTLLYDTVATTMKIGGQSFGTEPVDVTAPADGTMLPVGADPFASALLLLHRGADVTAGGNLSIFGTSSFEHVVLTKGDATLDPSFNRGGDTLELLQAPTDFLASQTGSAVLLDGAVTDVVIPFGIAGMTLSFPGGDDRTLLYDSMLESIFIGAQEIGLTPTALTAFA